jgi:DNA-binding transcriptional ArsR family regulator
MEEQTVITALAALAQPLRLRIFRALVVAGPQGLTPGTIAEALSLPGATLSFHLKELTHAGLVTHQRISRHLVYRADFSRMSALVAFLTENCCSGAACATPAAAECAC